MIEPELLIKIRKSWKGNGGRYTLFQLTRRHNLKANEVYCVLSISDQAAKAKKKPWKIHCYDEDFGRKTATEGA